MEKLLSICSRRTRICVFFIFLLLLLFLAYPRIRSEETVYLTETSNFTFEEFSDVTVARGTNYDFRSSLGFSGPRVRVLSHEGLSESLEIIEVADSVSGEKINRKYSMYPGAVTVSNNLVAAMLQGNALLNINPDGSYSLVKTERVPMPRHVFEHEEIEKLINPENAAELMSDLQGHDNQNSASLRKIEFHALLAEDFAENRTVDLLVNDILATTLFANQYLRNIGFLLVPRGMTIYRNSSPFSAGIAARDPYIMLNKAVDAHHQLSSSEKQVSIVFSKSFFPRAAGLTYAGTSCVNPRYSGIFVTQGGTSLSQRVIFPATVAHEVGHFLGMQHDSRFHREGFSLMAPSSSLLPFGFSEQSILEQQSHSGPGKAGSVCFKKASDNLADSDGDGVSDEEEAFAGSDPMDAGSKVFQSKNQLFTAWNGFINLASIGEIVSKSNQSGSVTLTLSDMNGKPITSRSTPIGAREQNDLIFNELSPDFENSYGSAKLSSFTPVSGSANVYSHTGRFNTFQYITSQHFFEPVSGNRTVGVLYNTLTPGGFEPGSLVHNWLTIINFADREADFEVEVYSVDGQSVSVRNVIIPAGGRRDIPARVDESVPPHGLIQIRPVGSAEIKYFSFLSRYYQRANGVVTGAVILDAKIPAGQKQYLVYDNSSSAQARDLPEVLPRGAWAEIGNMAKLPIKVRLREYSESGLENHERIISLLPGMQTHIALPLGGLIELEPDNRESIIASALLYKGASPLSSVELLPISEAYRGEQSGSVNTFLSTKSKLIVANAEGKNSRMQCRLHNSSSQMNISRTIGTVKYKAFNIETLFPSFPADSYAPIICSLQGENGLPLKAAFRIYRKVDGAHGVYQALR